MASRRLANAIALAARAIRRQNGPDRPGDGDDPAKGDGDGN
jgi:hypothetical protein